MSRLAFQYATVHGDKSAQAFRVKKAFIRHGLSMMIMAPVTTHLKDTKYDYLIREEENLFLTMKKQFPNLSLLVIDDAHLLSAKQVDQLLQVAITLHIAVLCYGLRTDFRTSGFEGARRLLELSQVLLKIPTFCECGREALFSVRKENGKTTFQGSQIMDSDIVTYQALCPNCYYRKLLQFKKLRESGRI